jgi:glutaredoxin
MRPLLDEKNVHPAIVDKLGGDQTLVNEVKAAVAGNPVVVVGMRQNPVCKSACKLLDEKGVSYQYLEYGSYLSMWRERLAIKMWSGFITFPQIFIAGNLIGGHRELKALFENSDDPFNQTVSS